MNKEFTEKLIADFPELYSLKEIKQGDKVFPTAFSLYKFEMGDGWEPLVRELSQELNRLNLYLTPEEIPVQVVQSKEKFGGLRVYVHHDCNAFEQIRELTSIAEEKSFKICEICGTEGKLYGGTKGDGWYRVRCQIHQNQHSGT